MKDPSDSVECLREGLVVGALALEDVGHELGCVAVAAVEKDDGVGGDIHVVGGVFAIV